jgi:transcriptional regulator with XRE-family HTH domain
MIDLKELRNKRGLTIDEVCEKSGINRGNLSSIENNKRIPRVDTLEKILNALGYELTVRKIKKN